MLDQLQIGGVTIAQWNGLCGSGLVQFTSLRSADAAYRCALIADADRAVGWLIGAGLVVLASYLVRPLGRRLLTRRVER